MEHRELKNVIHTCVHEPQKDHRRELVSAFLEEMTYDPEFLVPVVPKEKGYSLRMLTDDMKHSFIPVYTDEEEFAKTGETNSQVISLAELVKQIADDQNLTGFVLNSAGEVCEVMKEMIWQILESKPLQEEDHRFWNIIVSKAVRFVLDFHDGQLRQGTNEPFVTLPLEMLSILNGMGLIEKDPRAVIAGILYNTLSETDATEPMLKWHFGNDVTELVTAVNEYRSHPDTVKTAGIRVKVILLAEALAEMRAIDKDMRLGTVEDVHSAQSYRWYAGILDALKEMQMYPDASPYYDELEGLVRDVYSINTVQA